VNAHARRAAHFGVPSTPTAAEWLAILDESGGKRYHCGEQVGQSRLVLEHVVALASGGGNVRENVVASCAPFNNTKSYDHKLARQHGHGRTYQRTDDELIAGYLPSGLPEAVRALARMDLRTYRNEIVVALREFVARRTEQATKQAS